jgi:tol-pal system protein YbgF
MRFSSRTLALTFGALLSLPVLAQDTQGLVDRLNRLERDLNTLQVQVYRGGGGKASGSGGSADSSVNGNAYTVLDGRISELEERLRDVTGDMEKNQNLLNQIQTKLDRMQQDDEFRFKQLEEKQNAAPAQPASGASPSADAPSGNQQGPGSPPGFLNPHPEKGAAALPPPAAGGGLPVGKTAAEQYDYARGLLQNSDYDAAAAAFKAFTQAHPQDPLAGSAAYWLGQIAYVQGHFDQAAVIFLDTYQKYPKSAHVAESLLKVGLSMGQLGKKKEACAALHRFQTEFPDASDSLKKQASAERSKQGC